MMTLILWLASLWLCFELGGMLGKRLGRAAGRRQGEEDAIRQMNAW